ncbi:TPA: type-F conjugative transfer system secretin TraK [Neisseria gonorrhoeae]|uniref:Conjugal transfer protein TraK n=1 Tax=Neisseria gonorrhoeae TaxID=485 RepID=A0AB74ENG6_NEIGO|nr:type-F conjugative transfer system secretin TraK [Neisseria gonorrhoeae]ARC01599.1 conjugal transfer protein TraK [Neisseria gonorrhoeae]ARC03675.1 conjugal transfer protein TraK [Neisseria gonorrhoeae]EEZ59330.1 conserved hypothetical protein [Neisseria gonorrhoeae SK-93-1035]KLS79946.1 conjugal transfer protein TraK [Neisseria gonorrhoeae MU_NG21]KLS99688.1 conjugal transfer protein TraK [Neisseria gonorrhoeae CH811]
MCSLLKKIVFSALLAAGPATSFAAQRVPATENTPHVVSISKRNLSRIAIEGGRISSWKFMEGDLELQKDTTTGQLFVRSLTSNPTNLFVISEEGKTYLLVLKPTSKQGDNIVIDVAGANRREAAVLASQTGPMPVTMNSTEYVRAIKKMMTSMMRGTTGDMGINHSHEYQTVPLWKDTLFIQNGSYTAADMQGLSFTLTNLGTKQLEIREQEFYRQGVLAVAVRKQILQPGEITDVFIISRPGG